MVVPDGGIEPHTGTLIVDHTLEGGVFLRVVQRGAGTPAVDGVARTEGLHAGRARPEGARDPLVAPPLLYPATDIVHELPERDPLIYAHDCPPPLLNVASASVHTT